MAFIQFVHTLNYGDAISGEAIVMKRLAEAHGVEAKIFALHAHEKVSHLAEIWRGRSEQHAALSSLGDADCVLNHYSIASPLNDVYAELTSVRRVLLYHNLTPPRWFRDYNPRVTRDLEQGLRELPALLAFSDHVLADSEYNRQELLRLGCPEVAVLPLLLDPEKWSVPANAGIAAALRGHGGRNILHVGRLAPNKCIEDILKGFYFYHHKIDQMSKLWLVGIDIDTELYSFELRRLISKLQLREAVEFVGAVADGELKAFYEHADVYVCMSEHEGFCLPLLEAMHFNLPVIAYDACAVSDTLGDAGILMSKKEPAILAEHIALVVEDESLRGDLQARGHRQVARFGEASFSKQFDELFFSSSRRTDDGQLLSQGKPNEHQTTRTSGRA